MIMYCNDCGKYFSEDDCGEKEVCLEDYYGVGSEFPDHHYSTLATCPHCNSTEIVELSEEDCIDEPNRRNYRITRPIIFSCFTELPYCSTSRQKKSSLKTR